MALEAAALIPAAAFIGFGVYADLAYNVMSANDSSPQTTELFAGDRADTLWHWVKMADYQIAALSGIGALMAPPGLKIYPLLGGGMVIGLMHFMYSHALRRGGVRTGAGGGPIQGPTSLAWNNPT
jgi:hypothetical protein